MTSGYRRSYSKYYGIDFSSEYEIHHINGDRKNNSMSNLILLPRELHQAYHNVMYTSNHIRLKWECDIYDLHLINEFYKIMSDISEWKSYKMYLDRGIISAAVIFENENGIRRI